MFNKGLIPSGKHTKNDGKSPCSMGKSTISMAIFHSYASLPEGNGIFHGIYPLVMTNSSPWKITMLNRQINYKWPFSMAILNNQRVYIYMYIYIIIP